MRRGWGDLMSENPILILTHVQRGYPEALDVQKDIRRYIADNSPVVYQLIQNPDSFGELLIQEGQKFPSKNGEIPEDLKAILADEANKGTRVVVAGGLEDVCLPETLSELEQLNLEPTTLFKGVFPKKRFFERLLRRYINHQNYTF